MESHAIAPDMHSCSITRRRFLATAALVAGASYAAPVWPGQPVPKRSRLGIVIYSLQIRQKHQWNRRHQGLPPALAFLEECHALGAGGIQCSLGPSEAPNPTELRRRAETCEMHVEAILGMPTKPQDVERFERNLRHSKAAGASLARVTLLPGRRYEQFNTAADFQRASEQGLNSLRLAEPVAARHRFRLAVENHKDHLVAEKLEVLRRISSEYVGLCVDVANNFALAEEPVETIRAFAPWAFTIHIKDQVLRESADGFWLDDAALGDGFLDLKTMVGLLRQAKPGIHFNLEVITRDPILVPMRKDQYWATFPNRPRRDADPMLELAKARGSTTSRPLVSGLSEAQKLELERHNVERSLEYARKELDL